MKRICAILLLLCFFNDSYSFPSSGLLIGEDFSNPNFIQFFNVPYFFDADTYPNGGLTFTYPNPFNEFPQVFVSLQLIAPFNPAVTYVAVITNPSPSGVTIRVNKIVYNSITNITTVTDAPSNEVLVNIWAVGS